VLGALPPDPAFAARPPPVPALAGGESGMVGACASALASLAPASPAGSEVRSPLSAWSRSPSTTAPLIGRSEFEVPLEPSRAGRVSKLHADTVPARITTM
jgi:hypothetical protein